MATNDGQSGPLETRRTSVTLENREIKVITEGVPAPGGDGGEGNSDPVANKGDVKRRSDY